MHIEGSDSKGRSAVEAIRSVTLDLQDTQGVDQGCAHHALCTVFADLCLCPECLVSVPPADNYPSTDKRRPSEEAASIPIEAGEVSGVRPGPLVENVFESSIDGAVKSQDPRTYPKSQLTSPPFIQDQSRSSFLRWILLAVKIWRVRPKS